MLDKHVSTFARTKRRYKGSEKDHCCAMGAERCFPGRPHSVTAKKLLSQPRDTFLFSKPCCITARS